VEVALELCGGADAFRALLQHGALHELRELCILELLKRGEMAVDEAGVGQ
jgi:hypothetical protein